MCSVFGRVFSYCSSILSYSPSTTNPKVLYTLNRLLPHKHLLGKEFASSLLLLVSFVMTCSVSIHRFSQGCYCISSSIFKLNRSTLVKDVVGKKIPSTLKRSYPFKTKLQQLEDGSVCWSRDRLYS